MHLSDRIQRMLQQAPRLPYPTARGEVLPYFEAAGIPPLEVFLDFQERYGAREIYAHSIGALVTPSIVQEYPRPPEYKSFLIVQGLPDREGKWLVGCGSIAIPNFIHSGSLHLHEDGSLYLNYKPWSSSVERWLMTEALASEMHAQGPWHTMFHPMVRELVDLGELTGLPRLTEDIIPYSTWWGDTTVRIQTGSLLFGHNPMEPLYFVRMFAQSNDALLDYFAPVHDALSAVSDWKMDRRDWMSGTWPEAVTGDS
jgi:hypothetical protein